MEIRNEKAWAIVHWTGRMYSDTVRATKRDAIAAFKAGYGISDAIWEDDAKYKIHRAIKVIVAAAT